MTLALLIPTLRAAVRERAASCVDIAHTPGVSVTLASGVFTRASGSWITAGFAAGQEVVVTGAFGGPKTGVVKAVTALALHTDIAGGGTSSAGVFTVALPSERAYEGVTYHPTTGRPFVAESFRPGPAQRRSIANASGGATIEHRIEATFALFYPTEQGTLAIERMAGALMTHFRPPLALSRDGISALVDNVSSTPVINDGGWLQIPVTASILAFTHS